MKILSKIKRVPVFVLVLIFVASILPIFINTGRADAISSAASDYGISVVDGEVRIEQSDVSLRWLNARDIEVTFVNSDSDPLIAQLDNLDERNDGNKELSYQILGWECDSNLRITVPSKGGTEGDATVQFSEIEFDVDFKADSLGNCKDSSPNNPDFSVGSPENSTAFFRRVDEATIERVDGAGQGPFIRDEQNPNFFMRASESNQDGCQDRVILNGGSVLFFELDGDYGGDTPEDVARTDCDYHTYGAPPSNFSMVLADASNATIPEGEGDSVGTAIGTQGDAEPTCELGPNPLGWIVCPIINGALRAIDAIFVHFIDPFLRISPLTTQDDDIVYQIWKGFRTIGNIVLLFALLFAVFGQSIGGGMVDAYTIKKIAPRILAAAILLNLSYFIVSFMVDIGNILGRGIGQIITAPIGDEALFNFKLGGLSESILGVGIIAGIIGGIGPFLATVAGVGAVVATGPLAAGALLLGVLAVALPAILIVLAVFITLILRQAIVLLMAIISPVALALWAVPGADKYTKSWFNTLLKAILVYPIVVAIFAIANVLAYILLNTGIDNTSATRNAVADLAAIIVLIAPMAMIPFSFKIAGGIMGSVSGFVMGSRGKIDTLVRGDKHNQHSRFYKKDDKGNVLHGLGGRISGDSGQRYRDTKKTATERLYRKNRDSERDWSWRGRGRRGRSAANNHEVADPANPQINAQQAAQTYNANRGGGAGPGGPLPPPTGSAIPGGPGGPSVPPIGGGSWPPPNPPNSSTGRTVILDPPVPPVLPPPSPVGSNTATPEFKVGQRVASQEGNEGEVIRFAPDGNPIVKYDRGNVATYTKTENLRSLELDQPEATVKSPLPPPDTQDNTKNNKEDDDKGSNPKPTPWEPPKPPA